MSAVLNQTGEHKKIPEGWTWSSKHTRLRYQVFILSILVFVLANYDVTLKSLPLGLGGFSGERKPSSEELLWLFFGLYVAVFANFVLCSLSETKIGNAKFLHLNEFVEKLNRNSRSVRNVIEDYNIRSREHADLVKKLDQLKSYVDSYSNQADDIKSDFEELAIVFSNVKNELVSSESDFIKSLNDLKDITSRLTAYKENADFVIPNSEHYLVVELRETSKSLLNLLGSMPLSDADLLKIQKNIQSFKEPKTAQGNNPYSVNNAFHYQYGGFVEIQKKLEPLLVEEGERLSKSYEGLNEKISTLVNEMNSKNITLKWQRHLEVWLPSVVSLVLVTIAIATEY